MTTVANIAFVLKKSDEPYLAKIPPRLVEPLLLAHAGNGYKHIAEEMLMIPLGTVKSRINRARERILKMRLDAAVALEQTGVGYQGGA